MIFEKNMTSKIVATNEEKTHAIGYIDGKPAFWYGKNELEIGQNFELAQESDTFGVISEDEIIVIDGLWTEVQANGERRIKMNDKLNAPAFNAPFTNPKEATIQDFPVDQPDGTILTNWVINAYFDGYDLSGNPVTTSTNNNVSDQHELVWGGQQSNSGYFIHAIRKAGN